MALNQLQTSMLGSLSAMNDGPLAGFRNFIMNGRMDFAQRGPGPFTAAGYTLDRWRIKQVGTGSTVAVAPSAIALEEFPKCLKVDRTTTGSTGFILEQPIEGVRILGAKTVTVSFYASCSNGISLGVTLAQNFGTAGSSEVVTTTQNQVLTPSPVRYSFTFTLPSIAGKTVGANDFTGLRLSVNQTQGNFSNLKITGVQLEIGKAASQFEHRFIGTELALCQRYYTKSYNVDVPPKTVSAEAGQGGMVSAGALSSFSISIINLAFPVAMRKMPTVVAITHSGIEGRISRADETTYAVTLSGAGEKSAWLYANVAAEGYNAFAHYTADAEL